MLVAVGVITGLCAADVEPSEPVHDQAVALLELSFKVTDPPIHIGPLLVAPVEVGTVFTVTVVV